MEFKYIIILLLSIHLLFSLETADIEFILQNNPLTYNIPEEDLSLNFEQVSEHKLFLMSIIRLYQHVISTQQVNTCTFTPSCSRFGYAAISRYGFTGLLMASDRFQRCHGRSNQFYERHPETGRLSDPLEKYYLGKRK